jgi:hypothetical protein
MSAEAVKQLKKKLNSSLPPFIPYDQLSERDRAHCELVRATCDEVLYWSLVSCRWLGSEGVSANEQNWHDTVAAYFDIIPWPIRGLLSWMLRKNVWLDAWSQGLARHSPADQASMGIRILNSLEQSLRGHFVLGDTIFCEADCSLFGILNCFCDETRWPNPLTSHLKVHCPKLWAYHTRLRKEIFGDKATGKGTPSATLLDVQPVPMKQT